MNWQKYLKKGFVIVFDSWLPFIQRWSWLKVFSAVILYKEHMKWIKNKTKKKPAKKKVMLGKPRYTSFAA